MRLPSSSPRSSASAPPSAVTGVASWGRNLRVVMRVLSGSAGRLDTCGGSADTEDVPLIEVRDLKVYFPIRTGVLRRHTGDVKAVDGVSFVIEQGTTVGLVGESGSGKTTIGRALLKLVPVTAGAVTVGGKDILPLSEAEFRHYRREMQMIFQDPFGSLNPRLSIFQIVGEALEIHFPAMSRDERRARVAEPFRSAGATLWRRRPDWPARHASV